MAYTDKNKLRVVYGDYTLGVHGEGFDYIFSYSQGGIESIVKKGYEWLYRCPKPTFWRALTDNDRGSRFHIKSGSWLASDMFIDCKKTEVIMDGELQIQFHFLKTHNQKAYHQSLRHNAKLLFLSLHLSREVPDQ